MNPAFELLRKYKKVEPDTEDLVMKKTRGRVTQDELITIFEKGVTGDYGKFVVADPQTILGWINAHLNSKTVGSGYLATGLLAVTTPSWETVDWDKEANKCFVAFLNKVSHEHFHHCVYDRMMIDGKFNVNDYMKHFVETGNTEKDVQRAKRLSLKEKFTYYKSMGFNSVYLINRE